jgi:hypothetical protein
LPSGVKKLWETNQKMTAINLSDKSFTELPPTEKLKVLSAAVAQHQSWLEQQPDYPRDLRIYDSLIASRIIIGRLQDTVKSLTKQNWKLREQVDSLLDPEEQPLTS